MTMHSRHDPILVEVIRNELESLVDEMRIATRKTARSPMVKIGDFGTILCDRHARNIGVGHFNSPVTDSLQLMAQAVLEKYGPRLQPGDAFLCNSPYGGGSHIPDVLVVVPLFWRGELAAFVSIYSHHSDVGGRFPGSQSGACTETYEEGLHIPLVQYMDGGEVRQELLDVILANVRTVEDFVGDIDAKLAGAWRASRNLADLLDRHGIAAFQDCCDYLIEHGEQVMRAALAEVPDGEYRHEVWLRDNGLGPCEPQRIAIAVRVAGDSVTVDFAGTAPQVAGGVNMPVENTRGIVRTVLREILHPGISMNDGTRAPVTIVAPEGSLVNPRFPAATTGRAPLFFLVDEAIQRALSQAMPDRVAVPREAWDLVHYSRREDDGKEIALLDLVSGGWGGRPGADGPDGVSGAPMSAVPVELIEREYPLLVEGFGLVADTAGAGRRRGSLAVYRQYRFDAPGHVMIRTNRLHATEGLQGGEAGQAARSILDHQGERQELEQRSYIHCEVGAGDSLLHWVGGGGGLGEPRLRDPAEVARDVRQERISTEAARADYGVVLDADGAVDAGATDAARRALA